MIFKVPSNLKMEPKSRSFKMLQLLALNKRQKEKIADKKRHLLQIKNSTTLRGDDPDYIPTDDSDTEMTEADATHENNNLDKEKPSEEPKPKIIVLSNVLLTTSEKIDEPPKNKPNTSDVKLWQNNFLVVPKDEDGKENNDIINVVTDILKNIVNNALYKSEQKTLTKKGTIRKRKKFDLSPTERKKIKISGKIEKHCVKQVCGNTCSRHCCKKINEHRRTEINKEFWKLNVNEQKNFIFHSVSQQATKRKTTNCLESRRTNTCFYFLKNAEGSKQNVCKTFFLGTLGYEGKNDRIVRDAVNKTNGKVTAKPNKQGKHSKTKFDRNLIVEHIESFRPTIAHYRREHAPERRYLPSDINITMMYNHFRLKYPNIQFSYYVYREVVSTLKISFVKLGHEECWACESFDLHSKTTSHKKDGLESSCNECNTFLVHKKKYTLARKHYQEDTSITPTNEHIIASADLQKVIVSLILQFKKPIILLQVIMLPRMEMFKEAIFTPRIIAFNESFVITRKKQTIPTAVIWHEAITGRSTEDITSAFYAFFLSVRDARHVTLWLDNCSSQNKNWTILTFFVYIVNSAETSLESIKIKYFEPGHTFMGADSFHHQVERCLKQKGKVYDFKDFSDCVKAAAQNTNVISMGISDFYQWQNGTSQYKLNKISPRPYLQEMVEISFFRGKHIFVQNRF